ncbi:MULTISPECIES: DUF3034 family protein [Pseudoalteromonas]|jgi:hypothetical protein|uniref:DUF3034 domain-containing protein n=1 Tax=Pseudoalteromonas atlantica TaxID=288 RepID=A0ABQ0UIZ8_PSEAF|nr:MULTISPECIES: DUF3034 family protein [unclassified Pseudoalteromonas]MDY6887118.1 DUF3034 family protein [Pseudomonadota bacterium]GEK78436.1 hypothetical protein PAT01_37400 [Pseudoalteromonas atlantica]MDC9566201.1 DUF3034 family protein [Pseudoalteromonas sp. GAB2316C]MDC9567631.1 DUF3034 family protein [Pseudoalteromonas sp. GABNB9D]MDC9571908.1 DUF3034 family protein [Pseudoalteromonas sp. GABNS16A]|tara:strand:+ start:683 stop:1516 length:834 start_codon:yes stop_codon:yes gene_type:complete
MKKVKCLLLGLLLSSSFSGLASDGKLLATPGVSQIEGSGGGGIVPWAQLAGYASEDEFSVNGFCSRADVTDYTLDVCGAQVNLFNRVELSYAQQRFDVPALDTEIEQSITGAKIRLYGDIVYSDWPQLSVGIQHKSLDDGAVATLVGAQDTSGTDYYLAASKLHLGAVGGLNWFWNVTTRYSEANQLGLLGYGGANDDAKILFEGSTAVFLSRSVAVGIEYRQKSNNLNLGEQDWKDLFVAWMPNKHVSVTAAYLDLGSIAGASDQTGWYLSVTGYW